MLSLALTHRGVYTGTYEDHTQRVLPRIVIAEITASVFSLPLEHDEIVTQAIVSITGTPSPPSCHISPPSKRLPDPASFTILTGFQTHHREGLTRGDSETESHWLEKVATKVRLESHSRPLERQIGT
ncbi:hypothetical protein ABKN59_008758 [Abortiporus biennis]